MRTNNVAQKSAASGLTRRSVGGTLLVAAGLATMGHRTSGYAQGTNALSESESHALEKLVDAAKKEGHLAVYSSESGAQVDTSAADFQKRYGITVEATRLVSGDLTARYAAEMQSGRIVADVISLSDTPYFTDHPDWWLKLDDQNVPGLSAYPKKAYADQYATVSQSGIVIAYNTDMISPQDAPKGYKDLLDKRFSAPGTVVIADPRATQTGMSFFWAMVQALGPGYYEALMKQKPAIGPGAAPSAQLVGAGANAIGIGTFANHVQTVKNAGGPIASIYPPELATGSESQIGVSTKAPHPNAARLYAAYRISRVSQEVLCKVGGSASPLGSIPGCEPPAPDSYVETNYQIWRDRAWQAKNLPLIGLSPRQ